MENENKSSSTLTSFGETKVIESTKFNPGDYIGTEVTIEKIEEREGAFGPFIKVVSSPVHSFEHEGETKHITASKVFGLKRQDDGSVVWIKGSKLDAYLQKQGVAHYNDLVGIKTKVITVANKEGKEFLTFN